MVILLFILHTVKEQDLKMIIRQLAVEDYDALVALWEEAGLSYRPNGRDCREKIAHEIAGTTAIFLVAEQAFDSAFAHGSRKCVYIEDFKQ